jgi:hypothetical protein
MRVVLMLLSVVGVTAAAQSVPTTIITKPDAVFAEPFSSVIGLRELGNGRVVVSDRLEKTVAIIDFATGDVTPLGREGQGPGEYGMPGPLFRLAGDSTLMLDYAALRGLVLSGDRVGETVPLTGSDGLPFIPRAVDGRGRLYSSSVIRAPGGSSGAGDSLPISRLDPASGIVDTAAWIGAASGGGAIRMRAGSGGGSFRTSSGMQPYAPQDGWAVTPDGRIAIVRADRYRVEWIANGKRTVGPALPHTPVKIGSAEKEEWADRMAGATMMIRTMGGPGASSGGAHAIRPQRPNVDELEWPAAKPPFESQGVFATPEGELWILTSQPAGATRQRYDVVDGQGRLVRRVELADDCRLVGFGRGTLYTVRRDSDDLEWLERFARH